MAASQNQKKKKQEKKLFSIKVIIQKYFQKKMIFFTLKV